MALKMDWQLEPDPEPSTARRRLITPLILLNMRVLSMQNGRDSHENRARCKNTRCGLAGEHDGTAKHQDGNNHPEDDQATAFGCLASALQVAVLATNLALLHEAIVVLLQ